MIKGKYALNSSVERAAESQAFADLRRQASGHLMKAVEESKSSPGVCAGVALLAGSVVGRENRER